MRHWTPNAVPALCPKIAAAGADQSTWGWTAAPVAANIPATTAPMIHFRNQPTPCQDTSPIVKIP